MNKKITEWAQNNSLGLFIFNSVIMLLVLLHNAGYFHPFFLISVNFITIVSLILAVILLRANSVTLFFVAIIFWGLTGFFKVTAIDIWAERSSLYAFNAFVIGVIVLVFELIFEGKSFTLMSGKKENSNA